MRTTLPKLFTKDDAPSDGVDARIGELWEVSKDWEQLFLEVEERSFILLRQIGSTSTWDALCIETGALITLPLSSVLYVRVV